MIYMFFMRVKNYLLLFCSLYKNFRLTSIINNLTVDYVSNALTKDNLILVLCAFAHGGEIVYVYSVFGVKVE